MSATLAAEPPQVWVSAITGGFCDFDGHAMRAAKALRPPVGAGLLDRFDDEVLPPGFPESKQDLWNLKPAFGCDERAADVGRVPPDVWGISIGLDEWPQFGVQHLNWMGELAVIIRSCRASVTDRTHDLRTGVAGAYGCAHPDHASCSNAIAAARTS